MVYVISLAFYQSPGVSHPSPHPYSTPYPPHHRTKLIGLSFQFVIVVDAIVFIAECNLMEQFAEVFLYTLVVDPHVRVAGEPESVRAAKERIMAVLDTRVSG